MEMNVLVVDDSPMIRRWVTRTLGQIGFKPEQLFEASQGQEALRHLKSTEIDLVLLDLHMPIMDGETFVRVVRSEPKFQDLEIVIVSTESNEDRLSLLRSLGVTQTLRKPFEPDKLQDIVKRVEQRRKAS